MRKNRKKRTKKREHVKNPEAVETGQRLKNLRAYKKQNDVAIALGIKQGVLSSYETGNRAPPIKTLKRMAQYYNCTIDYLMGYSDYLNYIGNVVIDELEAQVPKAAEALNNNIVGILSNMRQYAAAVQLPVEYTEKQHQCYGPNSFFWVAMAILESINAYVAAALQYCTPETTRRDYLEYQRQQQADLKNIIQELRLLVYMGDAAYQNMNLRLPPIEGHCGWRYLLPQDKRLMLICGLGGLQDINIRYMTETEEEENQSEKMERLG